MSIEALLRGASLPTEGIDATLMSSTAVAVRSEAVVGSASIELHGRVGLLRSVVVDHEHRGHDLGRQVVNDRIDWARGHRLRALVLFTETAPEFFEKLGFERVLREDLPPEVHGSFEFGFCPDSSVSMQIDLDAETRSRIESRYSAAARRPTSGSDGDSTCFSAFGCGYTSRDVAETPEHLLQSSLGCGNPTAVAKLEEGEFVLDLGSGGGLDVLLSAQRVGPAGFAYGVETNRDMLDLAEQNRSELGLENVRFLEGRIESIPLEDEAVDVVISNCVLNLSLDKRATFHEAFRVLRPGGRIAIADIVARRSESSVDRRTAEEALGCLAGTSSKTEILALVEEAGFEHGSIDVVRSYEASDLERAITDTGEALAAGGHLMSVIVRATKPPLEEESR